METMRDFGILLRLRVKDLARPVWRIVADYGLIAALLLFGLVVTWLALGSAR